MTPAELDDLVEYYLGVLVTAGDSVHDQIAVMENKPTTSKPSEGTVAAEEDSGEAAVAAEAGAIVMSFEGPCWVDVRDSERSYKLFGEMKKGDRHVLSGTPPYSVILGNVAAVEITVGGAEFDLSAISRGNVARFTLNPDQMP